jgi:hypothetical protein
MKPMKQIPSLAYEDRVIVTHNGDILAPNLDYTLDEERENQVHFIGRTVKDHDVIQILAWLAPGIFDRTIIRGNDYIAFHTSYES